MKSSGAATLVWVHAIADPKVGGRNRLVGWLRLKWLSFYASWMLGRVGRAVASAPGPVVIVTDGYMHEQVERLFGGQCEIVRIADQLRLQYQMFDRPRPMVAPMLKFVDDLYVELANRSGCADAFQRNGISHLQMLNLRWLVPLTMQIAHGQMLQEIVQSRNVKYLRLIGAPPELSVIVGAAKAAGLAVANVFGLLGRVGDWVTYRTERQFFQNIASVTFPSPKDTVDLPKLPSRRRTVLVIGNYSRTVDRLLKLMPGLSAEGWHVVLLAARRARAAEQVRALGATVVYADQLVTEKELQELSARGRADGMKAWRAYRSLADTLLPQSVAGVPVARAAEPYLKAAMLGGFYTSHVALTAVERAIDAVEPDLLLSFEDWELNLAASLLGRSRGIPSLAYYCLSGVPVDVLFRRSQDWMATSGRNLADGYRNQFGDRISIVGDVLLDSIDEGLLAERRLRARAAFGFGEGERIILQLSTWAPTSYFEMQRAFMRTFDAARRLGGARVVVKAHPAESITVLRKALEDWGCSATIFQTENLTELSLAADLVSTVTTSAAFTPMAMRTPVVCLQSADSLEALEFCGFDFLKQKGVVQIPPEEDPLVKFRDLLDNHQVRSVQIQRGLAHAEEHLGPQDGKTVRRFVDLMGRVVSAQSNQSKHDPAPAEAG